MGWKTLVDGMSFGEGPRWHDGRLYYSDFYRHVVEAVDLEGNVEVIAEVANQPSGLGWLPDGRMLIVSMIDRKLLRLEQGGELVEHADLSHIATWHCNDMVVDASGRAYVGNFGYDIEDPNAEQVLSKVAMVTPEGTVSVVAEDIKFPNGTVILQDQKNLVMAETWGHCLTAFDIAADGSLSNRREWASVAPHFPDGICLDAEGAIWVADPGQGKVIRVREGGEITDEIDCDMGAFACALGGDDGKRLFVCIAQQAGGGAADTPTGAIVYQDVAVAGAGSP